MNNEMVFAIAFLFLGVILQDTYVDCIECYTCNGVSSMAECKQQTTCPLLESSCYKDVAVNGGNTRYTLGCMKSSSCIALSTNSSIQHNLGTAGSLVGRSASERQNCSDCCHISNCNRQLCHTNDNFCVDTADYDCAAVGSTINICSDTKHAKTTCRKFCGLCSLVDGGWAAWNSWSQCDVSCGNGSQSRTRACTDPIPAEGGDNCVGFSQDTQTCSMTPCPVHGGWSQWSPWGGCSSTCDIGMQRRDRSCSSPYPSLHGDHCFGESRDDRLCFPGACADGGWSGWELWSRCSKSCGDGLRSRARKCDNPVRSIIGRECPGDFTQTEMCNVASCHDGGWSRWGTWSSCSSSCGKGIHSRSRTCDNPVPSVTGRYCVGDSVQTTACNVQSCPAKLSAFTAKGPTSNSPLIFKQIVINEGGDYNPATGLFTCEYPGLYYFTVDLTKKRDYSNRIDAISNIITKNGNTISYIAFDPFDGDVDKGSYAASGSAVLHLAKGDVISITGSYSNLLESWSAFSGFLFFQDI